MQMMHCEKIYLSDDSVLTDRDAAIHDGFLIVDDPDKSFDPVWYSIGQSIMRLEGVEIKQSHSTNHGVGRIG